MIKNFSIFGFLFASWRRRGFKLILVETVAERNCASEDVLNP